MRYPKAKTLVVEDDPIFRDQIQTALQQSLNLDFASSLADARRKAQFHSYDFFLLDKNLPDGIGFELIPELKMLNPYSVIIVLTSDHKISSIAEALELGASDYLVKSPNIGLDLPGRIQVAEARRSVEQRCKKAELIAKEHFSSEMIGNSPSTEELRNLIKIFGNSKVNVLITGETGTGKELIARALNAASNDPTRPFVSLNCGGFTESLIESELFGHEKGAFTGAVNDRVGKIEAANGGDLFLDEIGELPLELQTKLLRVLQDGEFYRAGSNKLRHAKIRVISATNRNLHESVAQGTFREDLLFRINGTELTTVPLRERREEIPLLTHYFIHKAEGSRFKLDKSIESMLMKEHWSGNIRELKNRVERALTICKSQNRTQLIPSDFAIKKSSKPVIAVGLKTINFSSSKKGLEDALAATEKEYITQTLQLTKGDVNAAALRLGLSVSTVYRKMQEWGFSKKSSFEMGGHA